MTKVILIDIDNTLLDFHLSVADTLERVFKQFEIGFLPEYVPVFIEINDGLWRRIEKGELTREGLFKIRFDTVFKALKINRDGAPVETAFRRELFNSAIPVQGAKELLEYLSSKYDVYAASNAIYDQQVHRLKKAGLFSYIKDIFVSERIGFQKPTREFFDFCFNSIGSATKDQAVMIGDSLTADIKGGNEYGITTIWFNHGNAQDNPDIKPDYKVDKLVDIKNIL
jgi:YjjG family noncanonical pyrimidine nucleotidase